MDSALATLLLSSQVLRLSSLARPLSNQASPTVDSMLLNISSNIISRATTPSMVARAALVPSSNTASMEVATVKATTKDTVCRYETRDLIAPKLTFSQVVDILNMDSSSSFSRHSVPRRLPLKHQRPLPPRLPLLPSPS